MPIYYPEYYVDEGRAEADKLLRRMEREVHKIYRQAYSEMKLKADEYLKNFIKEDSKKRELLKQGKITKAEYKQWRISHMATGRRYFEYAEMLSTDMTNSNLIAAGIINGHMPEMYAIGYNFGTYAIEKQSLFETSFTLYDRHTVERLIRDKPDLLPKARINIPKDKRWNKNKINAAMTQSIIQGESIPEIAERISKVADMTESQAIRTARTMATSAENGGRLESYRRAEEMGMKLSKTWIATHDRRTRPSHRHVDGETVENINAEFSNGCLFPGDPDGDPEEIYNCRCTMVADVIKADFSNKNQSLKNINYREWKNYKANFVDNLVKNGIINNIVKSSGNGSQKINHTYEKLGETNFSNKIAVAVLLREFEQKYKDSNIEHCRVICPNGDVYEVHGDSYTVDTSILGDKTEGSINEHNHVTGASQYSFSWEDLISCVKDGTKTALAFDEKYRYSMIFPDNKIDEDFLRESYENSVFEVDKINFDSFYSEKIKAISDEDYQHEVIKRTCEKVGIKYDRQSKT